MRDGERASGRETEGWTRDRSFVVVGIESASDVSQVYVPLDGASPWAYRHSGCICVRTSGRLTMIKRLLVVGAFAVAGLGLGTGATAWAQPVPSSPTLASNTPSAPTVGAPVEIGSSNVGAATVQPANTAVGQCPFVLGAGCTVEWVMSRGSFTSQYCYISDTGIFGCLKPYHGGCFTATCTFTQSALPTPGYYPDTWTVSGPNVSIISVT